MGVLLTKKKIFIAIGVFLMLWGAYSVLTGEYSPIPKGLQKTRHDNAVMLALGFILFLLGVREEEE